jgi:Flp pilus assembly protein TadG
MKLRHFRAVLRRFVAARKGVAMLEFGLALPVVLVLGCYGIETANLAIVNLRISQIASNLADNGSRMGAMTTLSTVQLRELDLNNALQATRLQGTALGLGTHGRVILSSLENVQQSYDTTPTQRIHWQRCFGMKSGSGYDSSYGTTSVTAGTDATKANAGTISTGMGDAGATVSSVSGSALIFVEVNYDYQRLFGGAFMGPARLHYVSSFLVRDRRDLSQLFNPAPTATRSTCDKYTS